MMRAAALWLCVCWGASGYSVLSHEGIVDAAWEDSIKPILKARFPNATDDDLLKAHGYVYGGAIIQDMGYYPFGSHEFSDLTHYFRSGDFIVNMIASAQDLDEYAFALGALAHYAADNEGHPVAVNRAVPMEYPKVRRKFGNVATYEDNKSDHLKMEFAFDVSQVAEGHYAPKAYHDFIGFEVSKPLLERAFEQTYDVKLTDVSRNLDLALGTYRWTVSSLIPQMTRIAWNSKKKQIQKDNPGIERRKFIYAISRSSYEREWGKNYSRPGFVARLLSFLFRILPKIGPLSALAFHPATPQAQKLFQESFVRTLAVYKSDLERIRRGEKLALTNTNFDTGEPARAGKYRLADQAVAKLRERLAKGKGASDDPALDRAFAEFAGTAR